MDKGQMDEAIVEYQEAIRLKKDFPQAHCNLGSALLAKGQVNEAIIHFRIAVKFAPNQSEPHNELAWLLATCPDLKFRNPPEAVQLAKRAVDLAPQDGGFWNTLGVASYRAGDWQSAVEALNKSMELRQGGYSSDLFFLAMAIWRLDKKELARKTYLQAVAWMEKNKPQDKELLRFREEAAALLKTENKPNDNPK
jgi:Flp pilus assembly protein TadD